MMTKDEIDEKFDVMAQEMLAHQQDVWRDVMGMDEDLVQDLSDAFLKEFADWKNKMLADVGMRMKYGNPTVQ